MAAGAKSVLRDINLSVKTGQLVIVSGQRWGTEGGGGGGVSILALTHKSCSTGLLAKSSGQATWQYLKVSAGGCI